MIIVEGPDGAGKTTLVEMLVKHYGFMEGVRGTDDRTKLWTVTRADTYGALGRVVVGPISGEDPIIWDRLFYSEEIYAPAVGRVEEFSSREKVMIRRALSVFEVPLIMCLPPLEAVKYAVMNSGKKQMDGVEENIERIWYAYREQKHHDATLWYDFTGEQTGAGFRSLTDIIRAIDHYLVKREERGQR